MQALNYNGPYEVSVQEIEKPKLEHPDDIIVKVTTVGYFPESVFVNSANLKVIGCDLRF